MDIIIFPSRRDNAGKYIPKPDDFPFKAGKMTCLQTHPSLPVDQNSHNISIP